MQIGLNIFISGLTGKLIIQWSKASTPLAETGRSAAFDFPYDDVYVIPNLSPIVYIVRLWRSDDGVSLDQLIKDWSIDASKITETTIRTYQYKVDRGLTEGTPGDGTFWADPENLDTVLIDERLDGFTKEQMLVHEAGFGNKLDAEYDLVAGGGIELLGGKTFDTDVAWFITVASSIESTVTVVSSGNLYAGVKILTADDDFDIDLWNKLCVANFPGAVGVVTFPDMALIPDDTRVTFQTHGGSQNYLKLQLDTAQTINFFGVARNVIYLAKGETIDLYFKGGVGYVVWYKGNANRRGSIVYSYSSSIVGALFADESIGELVGDDYPGLFEYVESLTGNAVAPIGLLVGQWGYSNAGVFENKQKFGLDSPGGKLRVPHLSGLTAKVGDPGVLELDQVGELEYDFAYKQGKSDDNESGVSGEYLRKPGASGGTNYGNTTVHYLINENEENRVKSYLQKPFVLL